ncbi:MAG TPA: DUF1385 domain-containing protein [Limnochordia bacterium]
MSDRFYYGGQAVIEGVMMRGRHGMAIAVRKGDGRIVLKEEPLEPLSRRFPILKRPVLRGVLALFEALTIGVRALNYSAAEAAAEEEVELGKREMAASLAVACAVSAGLFIVLPALVIRWVQGWIGSNLVLNTIEGLIKIAIFLGYIGLISFMRDIRRVFEYHGAEHKAINCFEAGEPLTVERVQRHSRIHRRCGTSFILFVLLVSILLFSFFGRPPFVWRVLIHLALLPLVAGISYEIIRQAGKPSPWWPFRVISYPGMWTQRLTTREPSADQIEVAIAALEATVTADRSYQAAGEPIPLIGRRRGAEAAPSGG